jgi:NAD(P)-dependent dehydrogenase (short-subunit alcohol dehydrogenase family)
MVEFVTAKAWCFQDVKGKCKGGHAPEDIVVLPLDVCGDAAELNAAAKAADAAFDGAGVDYLVHNAGQWESLGGIGSLLTASKCLWSR